MSRGGPGVIRMPREARRQQLIEAGMDLLEYRPMHELALDEVAEVAGVSRTLVFHYFPTKTRFFAEIVAFAGEGLLSFDPELDATEPQARLRAMVTSFLTLVARKRGAYISLVRGASGGDPEVLKLLDDLRDSLAERWLEAAEWPVRDPVTKLAVRGWLGYLEEVALCAPGSVVEQLTTVELLVAGLHDALWRSEELGAHHGERLGRGAIGIGDPVPATVGAAGGRRYQRSEEVGRSDVDL